MKPSITIAPIERTHIPVLAELAARTFTEAFGSSMEPEELKLSLEENRSEAFFERTFDLGEILGAWDGEKLVGYVQFGKVLMEDAGANPEDGELGRLYVDSAYQRQGIGRRLMEAALDRPRMKGAPRVFLQVWDENHKAIALYRQYGFEVCGETHFVAGGRAMTDLVMVRMRPS